MNIGWILLINYIVGLALIYLLLGCSLPRYIYDKFGEDVYKEWSENNHGSVNDLSVLFGISPGVLIAAIIIICPFLWEFIYPFVCYYHVKLAKNIYQKLHNDSRKETNP